MLRRILITLGVIIAILPHLGFPSTFDTFVYTFSGLIIVFLLAAPESWVAYTNVKSERGIRPHSIHITHSEVKQYPDGEIEREVTVDKEFAESPDEDTTVEKKTTIVHARKRRSGTSSSEDSP